jgi:hypothetical protein
MAASVTDPDGITAIVSKLGQSEKIIVHKKYYTGSIFLEISIGNIVITLCNRTIKVSILETNNIVKRSSSTVARNETLHKIDSLVHDLTISPNYNKEKQDILSLLHVLKDILSLNHYTERSKFSVLKEWISPKQWMFTVGTPYILEVLEAITVDR